MSRKLPNSEIKQRLQQLRNVTKLHAIARQRLLEALATIKALKALLASQDARIAELETKLADKEAQRKTLAGYLYKAGKESDEERGKAKPRGKKPGSPAFHRPKPESSEVTERIIFSINQCPICKHPVGDPVDQVDKYEEDIDLAPHKQIKHHTITRHWCGNCEMYVKAPNTPKLERIGINVLAYVLYARYRLRLTIKLTQESLADLHNFTISEGEIVAQLDKAKEIFGKDYEAVCELIKTARVVYADETGWRMDGDNWYLWAFVSPEDNAIRYELAETRGGGVAKDALGQKPDRVIVSDGYAIYGSLPGLNQQCWVHLLRVAKVNSPTIYQELCQLYEKLGAALTQPGSQRDPPWFRAQLQALSDPSVRQFPELTAPKVQNRIQNHLEQLLVCLEHDGVLPENNTAERAIRPQVIMRKIFGSSRSPKGAETHAVNTSVITTQLLRNPDKSFFEVVTPMLQQRQQEARER